MNRVATALLLVIVTIGLGGCRRHAATRDECRAILDRIVELELHELGFRDPVLARRKADEASRAFAPDLARCDGVRIPNGAMRCVQDATTVEEISHRCLH